MPGQHRTGTSRDWSKLIKTMSKLTKTNQASVKTGSKQVKAESKLIKIRRPPSVLRRPPSAIRRPMQLWPPSAARCPPPHQPQLEPVADTASAVRAPRRPGSKQRPRHALGESTQSCHTSLPLSRCVRVVIVKFQLSLVSVRCFLSMLLLSFFGGGFLRLSWPR